MDSKLILEAINKRILDNPFDIVLYEDSFSCIRNMGKENGDKIEVGETHILRDKIRKAMVMARDRAIPNFSSRLFELNRKCLIYAAPDCFDDFMLALEINRPMEQQFWLPRRKHLFKICQNLNDLEMGNLDELFLSQPARTGKTTLIIMFLLWVMGRDSERSNLYCSYTDIVVGGLYNGLLEMLTDTVTYSYFDVFPNAKLVSTNAKDLLLNLDRKKRYASFTGRSLYGTLNGACDCNGYLIGDDLISGIEEAKNKDRLNTAWEKVDNNLLPRAKEGAKIVWIGTRWSLTDPQGKRIDLLENEPKFANVKWKVFNVPALDEQTDESNFDYDYGVGFSTEFYRQRRASFERNGDIASWLAQCQGHPIERDGAVFNPESLRYYNGVLPDATPDRIFMSVDPAWGGGDYVSAPIFCQYADDLYMVDVIYDNSEKNITQPLIVNAIKKYGVQAVKVEGTKMTASYGEDIDKALRKDGIRINIQINTNHFTGNGKRQRIFDKAPEIRERILFLADGNRTKPYQQFMTNVFSFTINGKQAKHDDAPDSLAMACEFAFNGNAKAEVMKRFW